MSLLWSIYDRISDVVGPEAPAIALVVALAVAFYWVIGAARPST